MPRPCVILDLQHKGKFSRPDDRGVGADLDGDGLVELHEREAELTPIYAEKARQLLSWGGIETHVLTVGEYADRWKVANQLAARAGGRSIYIACHLNGGASWRIGWGLVGHDPRSKNGRAAARTLATALEQEFANEAHPWPVDSVRVVSCSEVSGYGRMLNTIRGIYMGPAQLSGVCYEPFSLTDFPEMATEKRLEQIGHALAIGCHRWIEAGS